jgi:hypothetical protein
MVDRHTQLVRDKYLKELHEKMVKHNISFEELKDFAENRYVNKQSRMESIRNEKINRRKMLANLEKARAARSAKKGG